MKFAKVIKGRDFDININIKSRLKITYSYFQPLLSSSGPQLILEINVDENWKKQPP